MGEFKGHRDGREMDERGLELGERIADLEPRPQRNGGDPGDEDGGSNPRAKLDEITQCHATFLREDLDGAEKKRAEKISVGDDAAGARSNRKPAQDTRGDARVPGWQHLV